MISFSAEYGNFHFLFGDEDEYYTESLLKLNLKQYLNYCFRKSGFTKIYFLQDTYHEKGRYSVEAGNAASAEEYYEAETEGLYRVLGKKTVYQESLPVMQSGREIGKRQIFYHTIKENVIKRIHYLLKNKHGESRYAFIIPLNLFCDFYESMEMRRELQELLRLDHKTSVILLTASMKADESFSLLTENPIIFCSGLFPEMERILHSDENLRFYQEMHNELGSRFHALNQLSKGQILSFLVHLYYIEGQDIPHPERLEDYAEVLYDWYHIPDFGLKEMIGLPMKSSCHLSELRDAFRQGNGQIWTLLDGWVNRLYEGKPEEWKLKDLSVHSHGKEIMRYPMFVENGDVRRLRRAILGIAGPETTSLSMGLWKVEQLLLCPFSRPIQMKNIVINSMLKFLDEMKVKQIQSEKTAVSVLDYLNYTIYNKEKDENQKLFQMKCDCYEQRIRCSGRRAELKKTQEEHIQRRDQYRRAFEETKKCLEEMRKRDPLYDELIRRMLEGTVNSSYVALHAPEVNQKKGELIRLDKAIKNETTFITKNQEEIQITETSIHNLELTLTELFFEKNLDVLSNVLHRASQMLRTQGEQEEKICEELFEATDKMQGTFDELSKTRENEEQSNEVFAELMCDTKIRIAYEI